MIRLPTLALTFIIGSAATAADDERRLVELLSALKPGNTVEVPDGVYTLRRPLTLRGLRGEETRPIVIRAAHRGQATIAGTAGLVFKDCERVVLEGFVFENDADQQCVRLENCRHVRLTRHVFRPQERNSPRHWEHWVTVEGARSEHNRIDHNRFEKKVNRGSPLFVRGDDEALICSQHDRVDHNHFRDVVYANRDNGHETIRTGGNDLGASGRSSFTIIEENLLERCSGENECMSLKSSDNIVRRNTLLNCRGAICMRLGNRNVAEGNIIMATEAGPGYGGIKLFGFEHRVVGNYFAGLTGTKHEAPFSIFPGMHDRPTTENLGDRYDSNTASAATRCVITDNTWVDCAALQFGLVGEDDSWKHLPTACTFTGNRVLRTKPQKSPLIVVGEVRALSATGNVAYDSTATHDVRWSEWFRWEQELPTVKVPPPLTAADVGPDAP